MPSESPNSPWDDKEAGDRGDCTDRAPRFSPDANCDADDVWPRHELAKAHDVGKFLLADPAALLHGDPTRPDDPAAKAAERAGEERDEERRQRNRLLQVPLMRRLGHLRSPGHRAAVGPPSCRLQWSIRQRPIFLGRAHLLKLDQQQDVVDAFDDAAD